MSTNVNSVFWFHYSICKGCHGLIPVGREVFRPTYCTAQVLIQGHTRVLRALSCWVWKTAKDGVQKTLWHQFHSLTVLKVIFPLHPVWICLDSTYTCYIWSSYHIPVRRVLALSSPCRYQGAVVRSPKCHSLSGLNELGSLSLSYWGKCICTCPHFSRLAPIYWFPSCASGPKAGHSIVKHGLSIIILKNRSVHWVLEGLKYSWWTQISETGQSSGDTVADQWDV